MSANVAAAVDGGGTVVCVSHGAAIRAWACARADNVDAAFGEEHGLPNTGVVVLAGDPTGWRVERWLDRRCATLETDPTGSPVS